MFSPVDPTLFFSRQDPHDPRLGDLVKPLPALKDASRLEASVEEGLKTFPDARHFVLAGYPDDEGIRLNGGRLGASQAPAAVRRPLYKMTPSLTSEHGPFVLWDGGDLDAQSLELGQRHETASRFAEAALRAGATWLSIGGGHDYGFPDADGFLTWAKATQKARPLVINFDAHLDVRPDNKGFSSGTPFYRMLQKHGPDVDFLEVGIQAHCNSRQHLEFLRSHGGRMLMQEELEVSGEAFETLVLRALGDWALRSRPVFLSIDIDGFTSAVAPGCSQSWTTGFTPRDFFPCLEVLLGRFDVRAVGIYEVSPPLDQDDRTAKLAAQIFHRVLSARRPFDG